MRVHQIHDYTGTTCLICRFRSYCTRIQRPTVDVERRSSKTPLLLLRGISVFYVDSPLKK